MVVPLYQQQPLTNNENAQISIIQFMPYKELLREKIVKD